MKVEFDCLVIHNSKPIPKGRAGQVLIIGQTSINHHLVPEKAGYQCSKMQLKSVETQINKPHYSETLGGKTRITPRVASFI